MLGVAALANVINAPFVQNKIVDVAIHPLDPFQDKNSYEAYLRKLNDNFRLHNCASLEKNIEIKEFNELKLTKLVSMAIVSLIKRKHTLLVIDSPYPVTDLNVDAYDKVFTSLALSKKGNSTSIGKPFIAIHYRQGVGNFAVYPGQSLSREIELEYFRIQIQKFWSGPNYNDLEVHVFTDAPGEKLYYSPPLEQQYLWEGTPGFANGVMEIEPLSFSASGLGVKNVVVHSGGDPLNAILFMSQASLLILGRSSLSYVAGILNQKGLVIAAPDFWHPPLSRWH